MTCPSALPANTVHRAGSPHTAPLTHGNAQQAILCFVSGVCKDRIIGMGDFGGKDDFKTARLEARIGQCGVIHCSGSAAVATNTKMFGFDVKKGRDSDSDTSGSDSD